MASHGLDVYMPIIILMAFACVMIVGALLVGRFLRPHNPNPLKETAYECGEQPVGVAWSNFNVRFYVVSLIFIIFDVEGALMFPVAAVFKAFVAAGMGAPVFASFLLFILVLFSGVIYCWKKGDFDWVRSFKVPNSK